MTGTCNFEKCYHIQEEHDENICWHIVDLNAAPNSQSTAKYCQCRRGDVIRRYGHPKMGYMEATNLDNLITKKCSGCGDDVLLLVKETLCIFCKEKPVN